MEDKCEIFLFNFMLGLVYSEALIEFGSFIQIFLSISLVERERMQIYVNLA